MSYCKDIARISNIFIVVTMIFCLFGCVVTPALRDDNTAEFDAFAKALHMSNPSNRFEQMVYNNLRSKLGPESNNISQIYDLEIKCSYFYRYADLSFKNNFANTFSDTINEGAVYGDLTYTLYGKKHKVLLTGVLHTSAPYSSIGQGYADLMGHRSAEKHIAEDLASQLYFVLLRAKSSGQLKYVN